MWQTLIKDIDTIPSLSDFKLNKFSKNESENKLVTIRDTDSITTISRKFKNESRVNNFIVVDEHQKPLGNVPRKLFKFLKDQPKIIPVTKSLSPIKDFSEHFNLINKEVKTRDCVIEYDKSLKDVLRYFFTKQKPHHSESVGEFYPEAAIIVDNSGDLYSIISYKDVLKLLQNDSVLMANKLVDVLGSTMVKNSEDNDFLKVSKNSTYDEVAGYFEFGYRTIPVMDGEKYIGLMVSYIPISDDDMDKTIEDQYIYFADAFTNIIVSEKADKLEDVLAKFRTKPFFSSLPVVKNIKDFETLEGVISYTELLRWAYGKI